MNNFIEIYDDALPLELCQRIIQRFDGSHEITEGLTGNGIDYDKKRSWDINISVSEQWQDLHKDILHYTYPFMKKYLQKYYFSLIGALSPSVLNPQTGQPVSLNKSNFGQFGIPNIDKIIPALYRYGNLNVQKYEKKKGGYPHWHSEIYPKDTQCEELHRVLLFMFYLNDIKKGGETEFFYQNKKIAPKAGRMVIAPTGFTHTHRGNTPDSCDKYIVTSWVLYQRAETMYASR